MMGKTHFTVGLATALVVLQPESMGECMLALISGSLGGVTADNDTLHRSHAKRGHLMALKTSFLAILIDFFFQLGICKSIMAEPITSVIGLVAFLILWVIGYCSEHRTFTHSFMALTLYSLAVGMIHKPLALGFASAYLSHLLLDITNRKKVPLLYPLDCGICLKICYANQTADKIICLIGYDVSAALLARGLLISFAL